jgi:hypothetical protein
MERWMELESMMLNEISQTQKNKYHMLSFIYESLKLKNKDMRVERRR